MKDNVFSWSKMIALRTSLERELIRRVMEHSQDFDEGEEYYVYISSEIKNMLLECRKSGNHDLFEHRLSICFLVLENEGIRPISISYDDGDYYLFVKKIYNKSDY